MATKIPIKKSGDKFKLADANALATSVNALIDESLPKTGVKTINGQSLIGTGDITITGSGGSLALGETSASAFRGDRGKQAFDHTTNTTNPHNTTKAQVGLGNVDNTTDINKPVSTATQLLLNQKEPIISSKGTAFNKNFGTTTGTVADGGALTAKQDALSSGVNIKTVNNESLIGSGNITITGGGSSDFTNSAVGATSRTITSRLSQEIWVEDFRATGNTDADVWEKAIVAMQSTRQPLRVGRRNYSFNRTIIVTGDYFRVIGIDGDYQSGSIISSAIPTYGRITSTVAPDTTIPTPTNPACMRGCAFYFTSLIYYSQIENICFSGFRFALAFLESHNSPVFKSCYFYTCNVAVIAYQGCQNFTYLSCNTAGLNVMHISSSTCFPAGTTYAGSDNYYTDSLFIKNGETAYGSNGGCEINEFFDTWFVSSILRPNVESVRGNGSMKYLDKDGVVYADTSVYCRPSGRNVFAAFRNGRIAFGWHLKDVDVRGKMPRGFLLCNTAIGGMVISGSATYEAMFEEGDQATAFFTIGAIQSAVSTVPNRPHQAFSNKNPMFAYSGRGQSSGLAEANSKYLDSIERKLNPMTVEGYSTQLYFDDSKFYSPRYLDNAQVLDIPTADIHIRGNKIILTYYPIGGTVGFTSGKFKLVQDARPAGYTGDFQVEVTWDGSFGLVKVFKYQDITILGTA